MKDMVSSDFFMVPTVFFRVSFVFVILSDDRRRPVHVAVTFRGPTLQREEPRKSPIVLEVLHRHRGVLDVQVSGYAEDGLRAPAGLFSRGLRVERTIMNLPSISNQNGAPSATAIAVNNQPPKTFTHSELVLGCHDLPAHPSGIPMSLILDTSAWT